LESCERFCEPVLDINTKLALEVRTADPAQFELEYQLTDEALFGSRSQSAIDREFPIAQRSKVRFEIVLVLKMRAPDVGEGGNT
jgi:hypothetical protein